MIIRNVKEEDIEKILEIYNYYIENTTITFEEQKLAIAAFKERVERITKSYPYIVAEENGEILGYAYLDVFNTRAAYKITADLSVYLDKDKRGDGVGGLLVNELFKLALDYGIENVVSIITSENSRSLEFHKKLGFQVVGRLDNIARKFGKDLGVTYCLKRING